MAPKHILLAVPFVVQIENKEMDTAITFDVITSSFSIIIVTLIRVDNSIFKIVNMSLLIIIAVF